MSQEQRFRFPCFACYFYLALFLFCSITGIVWGPTSFLERPRFHFFAAAHFDAASNHCHHNHGGSGCHGGGSGQDREKQSTDLKSLERRKSQSNPTAAPLVDALRTSAKGAGPFGLVRFRPGICLPDDGDVVVAVMNGTCQKS